MIYTLTDILSWGAKTFAAKDAFRFNENHITYSELDRKTDQLAQKLIDLGVKKGDRVGLYMERCLESAIAVYGIMKAGAAYVPMNPFVPASRNAFILEDCDINIIIGTSARMRGIRQLLKLHEKTLHIIGVPREQGELCMGWEEIFKIEPKTDYKPRLLPEDLAYIMYTSGSTGQPKGIMHTHYSGLSYAQLSSDLYGIKEKDIVANHAPLYFDVSTFGYFSALLSGATTVIIPEAHTKLPASLASLIEKENISIWYSVPLALIQLLQPGILEDLDMSNLRWVLFAGEVFPAKYLKELINIWPHCQYSNIYGPAELNQCTYYHLDKDTLIGESIPIGVVWDKTEYKILDENFKDVVPGVAGELIVHSATMMDGYWNDPARTKQAFFTEKLANGQEVTYYKTGDLVRMDENGQLNFLGRNDKQVKIRGYRIELGEIEAVLLEHDEVREVAATIMGENEAKTIGVAVLSSEGSQLNKENLIAYCKKHLPAYAIPGNISFLETFPRTGSDKIDRYTIQKILSSN